VQDELRSVVLKLDAIYCAVVVTAACLSHQSADFDLDASKVLVRLVSSPLSEQIEVLSRLAGIRYRGVSRTTSVERS
jgi:hypothetical protein